MKTHNILWWNLENLFEVDNFPGRPAWLQKTLGKELKGWNENVLNRKISQLASVIQRVNPDILGCCEIENESVLNRLVTALAPLGRNYKVLHQDTKDKRGIDVAFIYDGNKYDSDGRVFSLEIMKRTATRDLVQINLTLKGSRNQLILIGAHFPARSAGVYESEPFRMMVGETLSYWIMRTLEIKKAETGQKNIPIIVMGDFNDEPHNRSMTEYALGTNNMKQIENARSVDYLYNPMWDFKGRNQNTYVFGNEKMIIDQVLLSKSIAVSKSPFRMKEISIVSFDGMTKGEYNTPIRFSRPSQREFNINGFSDHLPVNIILEEKG